MEAQGSRSRVLGLAGLCGWTVVLGLATSSLAYRTDGQGAGVMIAVACGVLMWRIVATIGLPELKRAPDRSAAAPASLDRELSGSV
jgi:hypothetical protein